MTRRIAIAILSAVVCLLAACGAPKPSPKAASSALKSPNGLEPINQADGVLALAGYDVVAYFTEGRAVEGTPEFTHEYLGAIWQFASAAHRQQFAQNPQQYAPQYGGYCSWAVGHGYTADGDPTAWKIVEGRLYLNYNQSVKKRWEKEQGELIQRGDENYPRFLENKPEHKR